MIRRILTALRDRRERAALARSNRDFQRGWAHGMDRMRAAEDKPKEAAALIDCTTRERAFGTYNEFDKGVEGAVQECARQQRLLIERNAGRELRARRPAPDDAELYEVMAECTMGEGDGTVLDHLKFARAVLARWGVQDGDAQRLRELAAACYAGLGADCDLPENWLDALSAAAEGRPFSTESLLPFVRDKAPA